LISGGRYPGALTGTNTSVLHYTIYPEINQEFMNESKKNLDFIGKRRQINSGCYVVFRKGTSFLHCLHEKHKFFS